ncbi:type I-E CRISPR-associated protein Cas7/Cse4/CasC [Acetobacter peroxydans]|jgi:CRISPR system Cascade subunit CasC|uniref:type I-E CRISPR-associated protein Cas7/Cse4/CasC n=1 Tax=Acetobacter peroxydans TaxID=104098 RepID=UPI0023567895|nr:type I-E CRISPR-associated protein Cas7/Cse4/CasC [Acetobacter peroxydans]MCH4143136.1 type I-E CRISPR-associated protein Cas7/Cse4/CasC [Acetobacter peroxydans]MCI1393989.1 type I-E CRISPR-associated protein Cas7/Cse4/CasC [Acetobacter peroxydans]MCI1411603.1 type I-E CRISPR-associated protein Cas7/Cse4/CasC [Acetobacter peroxydans]MCI1440147.1 type I-E CRISPR-associated protein Cas7/Cse4/CasC [Acetobacter peroxydans]MCI1566921.1 type I-E CRISPR-associated protein Cas7/Cse4/CasC [Acetobact
MTTFLQFHLLTTYGPSNPNRDDQGRPKQAMVGGAPRLRMSSQSVKRALRESAFFALDLADHEGKRTKRLYQNLVEHLVGKGVSDDKARAAADQVAGIFGKLEAPSKETKNRVSTTLAFISPDEWKLAEELAEKIAAGEKAPAEKELKKLVLRRADGAVDIAMFGRMLADSPDYNREAAVQVAHAITTHQAQSEEDWFSAVDDLNKSDETGAGHLGETSFGSGVYYQYVCVNCDLLISNLAGDRELAVKGIEALAGALARTAPKGKQNSFAHHPLAHYILAESGPQAPRDLSGAFFSPVKAQPLLEKSVEALEKTRKEIDDAYGKVWTAQQKLHVGKGGTLDEITAFAGATVRGA